ncbi:MAG: hypothetical protein PV340_00060 [Wolbachia sp.]|nr:hypothetical protein [Wolbachia sp.]MDD9336674.1 hypothetical protein [Wolbachia sp.]
MYLKIAVGCAVIVSLGIGIAVGFTLIKMSLLILAMTAIAFLLVVVTSVSILTLYNKVKSEEQKNKAIVNDSTLNVNLEAASNLFEKLGNIPERIAEAGTLYLEIQKNVENITERIKYDQDFKVYMKLLLVSYITYNHLKVF